MIVTAGLYGFTAMVALASIILAERKRVRFPQSLVCATDSGSGCWAPNPVQCSTQPKPFPNRKPSERVASALRAWSIARVEHGWATAPRPSGLRPLVHIPPPPPKPEPKPEVRVVEPERRPETAAPTAAQRTHATDTPEHAAPASEPAARPDDRLTPPHEAPIANPADYYEILQISPNADSETIHRVYRIMAARFHPDNPRTGSLERFLILREAYQVLSDAARRTEYDATHQNRQIEPLPVFWRRSFVDGIEGEMNRRLGVLSLLYHRRRTSDNNPGISVLELERRMAFPREYLNFTLWYLRNKGYVT